MHFDVKIIEKLNFEATSFPNIFLLIFFEIYLVISASMNLKFEDTPKSVLF